MKIWQCGKIYLRVTYQKTSLFCGGCYWRWEGSDLLELHRIKKWETEERDIRKSWLRLLKNPPTALQASHSATRRACLPRAPNDAFKVLQKEKRAMITTASRSWAAACGSICLPINYYFLLTKLQLSVSEKTLPTGKTCSDGETGGCAPHLTRFPTAKTCSNCGVIGWCSIAINRVFRTMQMVMARST